MELWHGRWIALGFGIGFPGMQLYVEGDGGEMGDPMCWGNYHASLEAYGAS